LAHNIASSVATPGNVYNQSCQNPRRLT